MPSESIEPLFNSAVDEPFASDRAALAELYLACIGRLSPSQRRDAELTGLLDRIGRHLGVPDAE